MDVGNDPLRQSGLHNRSPWLANDESPLNTIGGVTSSTEETSELDQEEGLAPGRVAIS